MTRSRCTLVLVLACAGCGRLDFGLFDHPDAVTDTVVAQDDMATGADAPDTFGDAVVPPPTTATTWVGTGYLDATDVDDYYRVTAGAGSSVWISAWMTPPSGATYALELLDPSAQPIGSSYTEPPTSPKPGMQSSSFKGGGTTDYRAHIHGDGSAGTYRLYIGTGVANPGGPEGPTLGSVGFAGSCAFSGMATFTATATSDLGIGRWHFEVCGPLSGGPCTTPFVSIGYVIEDAPSSPATVSFTFDTTQLANGQYWFYIVAEDSVGNSDSFTDSSCTISN